jgi:hypothetical protein
MNNHNSQLQFLPRNSLLTGLESKLIANQPREKVEKKNGIITPGRSQPKAEAKKR